MPLSLPSVTHDPASGAVIPSAWGDAVNAAIAYLGTNKPRAAVFNSANISIADNTVTALTFNSERYDVGGCHSTVSNTGRLTVPAGEGGLYHIGGCVQFANNGAGQRIVDIRVNGTTFITRSRDTIGAATTHTFNVSRDYMLAAGDYVELTVYQNSGAALNVDATGNFSPEFWFRWVAATA